jgi:hypothetical protein
MKSCSFLAAAVLAVASSASAQIDAADFLTKVCAGVVDYNYYKPTVRTLLMLCTNSLPKVSRGVFSRLLPPAF